MSDQKSAQLAASDVYRIFSGRLFMADGQQGWWSWAWPNAQSGSFWVRMSVNQNPFSDRVSTLYIQEEAAVWEWDNPSGIPQRYAMNLRAEHNNDFALIMITVT